MFETFLQEMSWRGLIHQVTHEAELAKFLSTGPRRAYVGFDPTAPSLTIGNLMGIMTLRRFQDAGHQPVVIMGGGTGQIGDPRANLQNASS
jgi:tyrosyl-tRNA synthetase